MRTIRSSEIGAFLFCQRAWWYQKSDTPSANQERMAAGTEIHYQHGRIAVQSSCLRTLAYLLLLAALIVIVVYFTSQML